MGHPAENAHEDAAYEVGNEEPVDKVDAGDVRGDLPYFAREFLGLVGHEKMTYTRNHKGARETDKGINWSKEIECVVTLFAKHAEGTVGEIYHAYGEDKGGKGGKEGIETVGVRLAAKELTEPIACGNEDKPVGKGEAAPETAHVDADEGIAEKIGPEATCIDRAHIGAEDREGDAHHKHHSGRETQSLQQGEEHKGEACKMEYVEEQEFFKEGIVILRAVATLPQKERGQGAQHIEQIALPRRV